MGNCVRTANSPIARQSNTIHATCHCRNTRPPMPQIQPSTTSTSASAVPPAAAFEAPLRILKRPSPTNSKLASPLNGVQIQKSFKEREAQYQAARERIFGDDPREKGQDGGGKPKLNPATARSSIIRDPTGPIFAPADGDAKGGFKARQKSGSIPKTAPLQEAVAETMQERDPPIIT